MKVPLPNEAAVGFDALYGLELTEVSGEVVCGRVVVRDELRQPAGLVHGGVYAAVAESLASYGTALAVMPEGRMAMGLSNNASFIRPVTGGTIYAMARPRHRGRSTWVWEVEVLDDDGQLCALVRVTIAVREAPAG